MKVLVFGSFNIDRTYLVSDFALPGETVTALKQNKSCGGKGFNQAIALSRAGEKVAFAGAIGPDGDILLEALKREGIDYSKVIITQDDTGNATIQVDAKGQNSIIVFPGANEKITWEYVDNVLSDYDKGDLVVLQNEISNVDYIIKKAYEKKMIIAFNPSPIKRNIANICLSMVNYLIFNEVEGAALSQKHNPKEVLSELHLRFPKTKLLMTLGENGSVFLDTDGSMHPCGIFPCKAIDSTAAGDTYTGFFLSGIINNKSPEEAMRLASIASGIAVSRVGSSDSIPTKEEIMVFLQ